ncbi:MAG: hypothetical protein M0P09_01370 [Acholeplasmataceae bacterium]|nr:hypothetical protein [Acholeplasmataceae bacterium]
MNPTKGYWADPSDPKTWGTFEEAVASGLSIGYMLSPDDPYTIIDLDNKPERPASAATLEWYKRLTEEANSYAEVSVSGRGVHIVVKGTLPEGQGRRREGVEIYCQDRFMIMTGQVIEPYTVIHPRQELTTWLWEQLETNDAVKPASGFVRVDQPERLTDDQVMEMAWWADNGDKFQALWSGKWQEMGYPSQSEADLALMSMIAFYSDSDVQCLRLFRKSGLGKREKAVKNDKYLLNETLLGIRAKQLPLVEIPSLDELRASIMPIPGPRSLSANESPAAGNGASFPFNFTVDHSMAPAPDETAAPHLPEKVAGMPRVPGLIGDIAEYIYSSANRPAAEIALAAAVGMMAGIAGRAFNISGVGLNQYVVLTAKTGTGKEQVSKGIDALFSAAAHQCPNAFDFQGPAVIASGQALLRMLPDKPCFVSVWGEFGLTLQAMTKAKPGDAQHTLKRVLLDIYNKSGITSVLKPSVYADKEKNTGIVQAPNLTFIGESTPEEFYRALDEDSIMDGFIPRLMLIEYKGDRPTLNENAGFAPPEALIRKLADLLNMATMHGVQGAVKAIGVKQDAEGAKLLRGFNDDIDHMFHGMPDGPLRQILNRAHLKALKLAGLLAVGVNYYEPVVTKELAQWAINFVKTEVDAMASKFRSGEVGENLNSGENRGAEVVTEAIQRVLSADREEARLLRNAYRFPAKLEGTPIIPRNFLTQYLKGRQPFRSDPRGSTRAMRETINEMVESGMLEEVSKVQMKGQYGLTGLGYIPGAYMKLS